MATANNTMDVYLVVGKSKIPVKLSTPPKYSKDNEGLTVNDLCKAVEQHTNIKPEAQKLIHRGRTLFKIYDPEDECLKKSLSSLGMKNRDRVMVFGKAVKDTKEHDTEDKAVSDLMKILDEHEVKIEDMCVQCRSMVEKIKKNHGPLEECKKHKKFFMGQSEYAMQQLTQLDATPGDPSTHSDQYKKRRKALVNKLLENINLCDSQVSQLTKSIQEQEKGQS